MADKKISALTGATTPLAGTEVLPIVQSGSTVKVAVSDLTAGRAVGANGLTSTANIRVQYSSAGNVSSVANNTAATAGSMSQLITTNDASRSLRVQYSASGGAGGSALTNGISTETAQVFTDGNYPIVFGTNVSAALILDTSQNARIINNLIIGTAGKGITNSTGSVLLAFSTAGTTLTGGAQSVLTGSFNNIGTAQTITPANTNGGYIVITGIQPGIGSTTYTLPFVKRGGTAAIGTPSKAILTADPLLSVVASGGDIVVTPIAGNTYITYAIYYTPLGA